MNSLRLKFFFLTALFLGASTFLSNAQKKTSFLQINGTIKTSGKNLGAVEIKVMENGSAVQSVQSKDNGSFIVMMDLNKDYEIVFSKPGYIPKTIIANSVVPPDQADIGYAFKCNLELFEDVAGASRSASMNKPVAKIAYNTTYEDFDFDPIYTKRIQAEQQEALKAAADAKREQDRDRLDSLNKAWNDSIARIKDRNAILAAENAARDKARQDSISKATAASLAAKAHADSLSRVEAEKKRLEEIARNKAAADSIAAAKAQLAALEKARQDSIVKANLADKARQDSIAKASAEQKKLEELARQKAAADSIALAQAELKKKQEEDKAKAIADAKERSRLDSIAKADAAAAKIAEATRLKASADSLAKVQAMQKAIADSTAKANAAEAARQKALADAQSKATADSIAKVKAEETARQKALADSQAKARADSIEKAKAAAIEARKKFVADSTAQATVERGREKSRQDSITRAEANARALAEARKKVEADSIARAEVERQKQDALAKAKAEQEAKDKAEADRQTQLLADKARQDSITNAAKAEKEKEDADRKAQIAAEIQARKDALAKANTYEKSETKAPTTAVPKIKESDYSEGITDEKISETNRNIQRTVVKKDGTTYNYQKITYNWGGVFFFKNEAAVTQTTFDTELNQARKSFDK
jgi:hypothetical protein